MDDHCELRRATLEGFAALHLANETLDLTILPEIGGKIASLVHRPSGCEWLWRSPHLKLHHPVYGASYIETSDLGGIDECFPTVAPVAYPTAPWQGTLIPDHGELWCQPWETAVLEDTPQRIVLSMQCHGVRLPYHFERTLTMEAGQPQIELRYRVSNLSHFAMPFVWSIHPLLCIHPGMRLVLPEAVTQVQVDMSTGDHFGSPGAAQPWPLLVDSDGERINLAEVQPPDYGRGVKLYAHLACAERPVEAGLTDGVRGLYFGFRPGEVTHVGLWLNYGGWSPQGIPPYYNLGLEPCIGGS
ncbi:MAG: DUF5107 domain-containing protein, partial [Anaerolineae bacterium]|nr:DUF5107 domain-containing protein [Anaerolineae bacterium]